MIIKLTGAVLVLLSSTAIGALLALRVREQEYWLRDMKLSLFLLSGELDYQRLTLPEAMLRTGTRHDGRMKAFYLAAAQELSEKSGGILAETWKNYGEEVLKTAPIKQEQKQEFCEMGLYFSAADSTVRKNAVEFYLMRLDEEMQRMRANGNKQVYLYRMLGMLGGVFLLILVM